MLALRFYDRRDIKLEEIPKPNPKKGEVLIKVTDAGISQTQINEFVEGPFIINKTPHPLTHKATPLIPCQEYGGIIEEVGEGVDQSLIGEQVAVAPLLSCGECEYCKMGKENLCEKVGYLGLLGADGGFCEYSVVSVENIIPISQKELLTFIEPILVGLHAAKTIESFLNLQNKKVLILGAGAVGISVAAVFRDYFGANVFINDILEARLKRAQKGGFLTVTKEELAKEYDLVIDAAGMDTLVDKPAIVEGVSYLKKSAPLLNIGTYFHPVSYIPSTLLLGEHPLLASLMYTKRDLMLLPEVLKKLSVDFSSFITSIDLEHIIEDGYYKAEVDKESFTRIVVRP
ncbi:alcohol dehydrogenase catalytic domain-containing protein [Nitratiruptor tergarcus]|uniref:(R,R)-butanediol dehydrogenase / meso-butanediol dehydrogenase / diacetyl reductase n=1 Tax=Nitratiruptor tergarcus DSM 16512 TaxID=1069081 RepID=A0A1W1WQK2_9BACT|nr:alcohol dehydrogenase catalytic domain-containing protein [Nitratiruptor tergarcus]SMC08516.1 (R,R)-butanediol dehydrogenase / meso-butanediol dehydrogenase / diacetyl reductase [Nitratiruptor tergarcus DSM 16512]